MFTLPDGNKKKNLEAKSLQVQVYIVNKHALAIQRRVVIVWTNETTDDYYLLDQLEQNCHVLGESYSRTFTYTDCTFSIRNLMPFALVMFRSVMFV